MPEDEKPVREVFPFQTFEHGESSRGVSDFRPKVTDPKEEVVTHRIPETINSAVMTMPDPEKVLEETATPEAQDPAPVTEQAPTDAQGTPPAPPSQQVKSPDPDSEVAPPATTP